MVLRRVTGFRVFSEATSGWLSWLGGRKPTGRFYVTDHRGTYSEPFPRPWEDVPFRLRMFTSNTRKQGWAYWFFREQLYATLDDDLTPEEVRALVLAAEDKARARISRAVASAQLVGTGDAGNRSGRQSISDDVKVLVWQRDGGKCVRCGSNQNLEFDHIIPVVMGGANTARNLQLLCESCNRAKGGSLV